MAQILRLALIGKGRWGSVIKKTLLAMPGCELAYEVTHEWETLLEKKDIDGVIIATPPATHAAIALAFINDGVPVFIEKPMTLSVKEARQLELAAKNNGTPVMVGHIHLYNPAYREAKKLVQDVGRIYLLVGEGSNNGPVRSDYSAMWDWAPHDISMMLDVLGVMPVRVQAWGISVLRPGTTLCDATYIKLDFSGGTSGLISSNWLMPQKRKRLTIIGSKNTIVYDDVLAEKKVSFSGNANANIVYSPYDPVAPLTLEMRAFIDSILHKKKPRNGVSEGLAVVQILDAAERSIKNGGKAYSFKKD